MLKTAHLIIPGLDHDLHVLVGDEEAGHAIGHDRRQLGEQEAGAADDALVIARLESRADGRLVAAARDNLVGEWVGKLGAN